MGICERRSAARKPLMDHSPAPEWKETVIIAQEQIETSVGMAVILGGLGHFVDGFESCIRIIDIRHEGEVAFIGGF